MSYIDYLNESVRCPEQELEDLKQANGFTDADLILNRLGKIGKGQISRLIRQILRPLGNSFLVLAGWVLLVVHRERPDRSRFWLRGPEAVH